MDTIPLSRVLAIRYRLYRIAPFDYIGFQLTFLSITLAVCGRTYSDQFVLIMAKSRLIMIFVGGNKFG